MGADCCPINAGLVCKQTQNDDSQVYDRPLGQSAVGDESV